MEPQVIRRIIHQEFSYLVAPEFEELSVSLAYAFIEWLRLQSDVVIRTAPHVRDGRLYFRVGYADRLNKEDRLGFLDRSDKAYEEYVLIADESFKKI